MTPYFTQQSPPAFVATLPPMVENSQLAGSGEYQSRASAAARPRSALTTPAWTVAVRSASSTARIEVIRSSETTRQPSIALAPPDSPEPGAARDDRHAVARRRAHRGLDLARGPRPHERGGHPDLEQPRRRMVAAVGLQHVRVGLDGTGAAQVVQQARGRDAHRSASW